MKSSLIKACVIFLFTASANLCTAQKNIIINNSLAANAEQLPVKLGSQLPGKTWKFKFGDYAVVSSKVGWASSSTKSNLFNTKSETKSTEKFSFVLTNKENDSAKVNAANNITSKVLRESQILPHFTTGRNEVLLDSQYFSAFININGDTSDTWTLLMNSTKGSTTSNINEAILFNGERSISLNKTTSNKNGDDRRTYVALGYEFVENGHSLAAVQYFGGGLLGINKNIVWINKALDPKMKLVLAASMTAVMQLKTGNEFY